MTVTLTEQQADTLAEAINIAFGRAGASLSQLTGHRVQLEVPRVSVVPIQILAASLAGVMEGDVATVHQIFSGPVAGDALLVLSQDSAARLVDLLLSGDGEVDRLDATSREVLTEVGNILLNACLGVFGNLLHVHVNFSVPRLQLAELQALLRSLVIGRDELRYALVVFTSFNLRDAEIGGYLVIVLGVASFERLLEAVESLG